MSVLLNFVKSIVARTVVSEDCKMVLVVRADLPMGKGKTAAQCAHAALECYRQTLRNRNSQNLFQSWLYKGQPKIVLRVNDEQELLGLAQSAKHAGLIVALIRDAGRTQLAPGTISVLGIGPGPITAIDQITSHLRLL